jgi:hypothetical protein
MADDRHERLRLCADVEHHRQVRHHIIDALDAVGQGAEPIEKVSYNSGFATLVESLCYVAWPYKFKPATPVRYDGSSDPIGFLQLYAIAIRSAGGGNGRIMTNWFSMATKGASREWLMGLPLGTIAPWKDLHECFIDKFAHLKAAPEAM